MVPPIRCLQLCMFMKHKIELQVMLIDRIQYQSLSGHGFAFDLIKSHPAAQTVKALNSAWNLQVAHAAPTHSL